MSETLSIKMLDSPETARAELYERQRNYSQEEIDRLEGELSPLSCAQVSSYPRILPRPISPTVAIFMDVIRRLSTFQTPMS